MTFKVLLTGGSGYVGGTILHTITTNHPEYEITAFLRKVPDNFSSTYPGVKVIRGDYESFDRLAAGAEAADIVVHSGDSDHEASLKALITGLLRRSVPGYLIHLSGTGIVADGSNEEFHGRLNPKVWYDMTDMDEIKRLPAKTLHQNTETMIHETVRDHGDKINIAIMCPPDIYGRGKGPVKTQSVFVPMLIEGIKNLGGKVFFYKKGTNTRSWVHLDDLMTVYLKLIEAAASGNAHGYYNKNGYFFASTQEHSHIDLVTVAGRVLHEQGIVSDPTPVRISLEDLDAAVKIPGYEDFKAGRYLFASNSRSRPERAEKLFGYRGTSPGLLEALEGEIFFDIERESKK